MTEVTQRYCDNPRLQKIMVDVRDLFRWSRQTIIRHVDHPYEATLSEHIRICKAVCSRNLRRLWKRCIPIWRTLGAVLRLF